jgi:hypothetical protein
MSPIIGTQLAHDILDVEIDGGFRNRKFVGDLFVAMPVSNQPENF